MKEPGFVWDLLPSLSDFPFIGHGVGLIKNGAVPGKREQIVTVGFMLYLLQRNYNFCEMPLGRGILVLWFERETRARKKK